MVRQNMILALAELEAEFQQVGLLQELEQLYWGHVNLTDGPMSVRVLVLYYSWPELYQAAEWGSSNFSKGY